uniref:Transmembrane inner ear n=1 Tax=Rhabditophanes sp. KR3021 TaxID=114890 RepID=A0AC35TNN9_9BILA
MSGSDVGDSSMAALDQYVAPGLRLWMLLALIFGVLIIMVVIVCCIMRFRIPRTKRQIELVAAKRKQRHAKSKKQPEEGHTGDDKAQTIVMNSLSKTSRHTTVKDTALLISNPKNGSSNKHVQNTIV